MTASAAPSAEVAGAGAAASQQPPPSPTPPRASVGRQTVIYAVGELLSRLVSFVMLPLYTTFLTPADYGVVALVEMTFTVISIVAGARLAAGIFRFYHKADTPADRNAVVSTAFLLIVLAYAAVALAVGTAAAPIATLVFGSAARAGILRLAAVAFFVTGVLAVPQAYLSVAERPTLFVVSSTLRLFVQATLNYVLLAHLGLGVRSVFLSTAVTGTLFLTWLGWVQVRATGVAFSRRAASDLGRFWWPLILTQLALFVLTYGDRYFLRRAGGESAVGLYSLAYSFGFLLVQIGYSPFARVWDAVRFRYAREAERDAPFARAFVNVNATLCAVGVGIVLSVQDFLRVMAQPSFAPAAAMVPVILAAYLLQCWAMMHEVGIMVTERTSYNTLANWIGAVVAVAGYVVLIPRYQGHGAAWATFLSFLARWIVIYVASQRLWPIRYDWAPVARLLALSLATAAAGFLLPRSLPVPASIAAHTAMYVAYAVALWHLQVIDPALRARAVGLARRVRLPARTAAP